MKLYNKYIGLLILACFLGGGISFAQEKSSNEGEIVMSQSQLDSLLAKIVKRKKEQRAKTRALREAANETYYDKVMVSKDQQAHENYPDFREGKSVQQPNSNDNLSFFAQQMYREFDRLNQRIDWIMLNSNSSSAPRTGYSTSPSGQGGQPSVIYIQQSDEGDNKPFNPALVGESLQDGGANIAPGKETIVKEASKEGKGSEPTAKEEESRQLQNQIDQLNEKIRVLDKLGEATDSDEYNDEITGLNTRISELKEALAESQKAAEEERAKRDAEDKIRASLKELSKQTLTIYFANNSKALSISDKTSIAEYAKAIKDNQKSMIVKLHGFASNTGSAMYNNKISFERAEVVKSELIGNGIDAGNIVVLPHGIDSTGDANKARRVEVRLSLD